MTNAVRVVMGMRVTATGDRFHLDDAKHPRADCDALAWMRVKSRNCCKFGSDRLSRYAALVFSFVG